ncbi:FIST signal transduction protein [Aquabacterium sp.]|uniref:FIST signal transduction protein n=1 Tax=Aquabacterium sp. TaxID=1872578 RepID=UPI002E31351C|nr:FIST N-terminal domain-containing protein [Aquabacterium sp.]HEX5310838.1 FIST N-terminal domain-containing protein [Aquabacterium sp.]
MKLAQGGWPSLPSAQDAAELMAIRPQLAWVFADAAHLAQADALPRLQAALPGVTLVGCSTAGEISREGVSNGGVVITAVHFEHPGFRVVTTELNGMADSAAAGQRLGEALAGSPVHAVLVLGQGVDINGSALIEGLEGNLPGHVAVSGGLAGDGGAFRQTWTVSSQAVSPRQIVALGLTDPHIELRHGTFHGWQPFGVMRRVTRAQGNVLYELDGEPALDVYKRYLGEYARDLPGSGLLFPFEMLGEDCTDLGLIRTILGVDETQGSLILAGDIVANGYLRLMHATRSSLVDGAEVAAEQVVAHGVSNQPGLSLLISCVGRKLVLGSQVDEEVEAVADVLGRQAWVAGFYSYGEISPILSGQDCRLHNQTMTITHITERA